MGRRSSRAPGRPKKLKENPVFVRFMGRFARFARQVARSRGFSPTLLVTEKYADYVLAGFRGASPDGLTHTLAFALTWHLEKEEGVGPAKIGKLTHQYIEYARKFYDQERETITELFLEFA